MEPITMMGTLLGSLVWHINVGTGGLMRVGNWVSNCIGSFGVIICMLSAGLVTQSESLK